jgi:hypothetical protein
MAPKYAITFLALMLILTCLCVEKKESAPVCSQSQDADSCSAAGGRWVIVPSAGYRCLCPMTAEKVDSCKKSCNASGASYVNCDYGAVPAGSFVDGKTGCCCRKVQTGQTCGDGVCDIGETPANCNKDCGDIPDYVCGNGFCEPYESSETCLADCPVPTVSTPLCNNNGVCETGEKAIACSKDCKCGDGLCDPSETAGTCAKDCSSPCLGEGQVAYTYSPSARITFWSGRGCCAGYALIGNEKGYVCTGMTCVSEEDKEIINSNQYSGCCEGLQQNWLPSGGNPFYHFSCTRCGNGKCDLGETNSNCAKDCVCGDGRCDPIESDITCPQDCLLACRKEGEMTGMGTPGCCQGLTPLSRLNVPYNDGCEAMTGSGSVCTRCGDGACGLGEDYCKCPKDCKKPECFADGVSFRGGSDDPSKYCCPGLKALTQTASLNMSCGSYSEHYTCTAAMCGDGTCGPGEDMCNCPTDCAPKEGCGKEGELIYKKERKGYERCCQGLSEIAYCDGNGTYLKSGATICAKCGDQTCGLGENKINCPMDCSNLREGSNCKYKTYSGTCQVTGMNTGEIGFLHGTFTYVFKPSQKMDVSGTYVASNETLNPYYGAAPADFLGLSCNTPEEYDRCTRRIGKTSWCHLLVATQGTCPWITVEFLAD